MNGLQDRPDLTELDAEDLAPIELRMRDWPESWCDIARSLYIILAFAGEAPLQPQEAAEQAVHLLMGLVADIGGTQPYIPVGSLLARDSETKRIINLLQQHRQDYARVATLVGLSERHVRRIEARWLSAERAKRQGALAFE